MKNLSSSKIPNRLLFVLLAVATFAVDAFSQEQIIFPFQVASDESSYFAAPARDTKGNLYASSEIGGIYELTPPAKAGGQWLINSASPLGTTYDQNGLTVDALGNAYGTATGTNPFADYVFEVTAPCCQSAKMLYQFSTGDVVAQSALAIGTTGNLYGATIVGNGTIYELQKPTTKTGSWTISTIYNFLGTTDGCAPTGVIIDKHGNLYGIATGCGANSAGTIFELIPPTTSGGSWTEQTLYTFSTDGDVKLGSKKALAPPKGYSGVTQNSLSLDANGNLYGANWFGGASNNGYVYELMPPATSAGAWTFSTLYSFKGVPDGWLPAGGVVVGAKGQLYGTTYYGGPVNLWSGALNGLGTLYELAPPSISGGSWTETIVHNFTGGYDGFLPNSTPILSPSGTVFGMTTGGGDNTFGGFGGERACCGTVYEFVP